MTTTNEAQGFDAAASNLLLAITDLLATDPAEKQWIEDITSDVYTALRQLNADALLQQRILALADLATAAKI